MMSPHPLVAVVCLPLAALAEERPRLRPLPSVSKNIKTGPAIGAKIPAFSLEDQNGRRQTLESLRGKRGLVLAFVRSADW